LQRTGLAASQYPFQQQLFEDAVRDWLAFLRNFAREAPISSGSVLDSYSRLYPGLEHGVHAHWRNTLSWLFCSAEGGTYPPDPWNIHQGKFHKFLIATGPIIANFNANSLNRETGCGLVIPVFGGFGAQMHRRWNRFALCNDEWDQGFGYLRDFKASCRRMVLSKSEYQAL
jgi:hypothetical protein